MVEYGIVKFFDERDGKKFGFLQPCDEGGNPSGKKDVFFHYNDGRIPTDDGEDVIFGEATVEQKGKTLRLKLPQKDDQVAFERAPGRKGDKASPWAPATMWQRRLDRLANRPTYRVTKYATYYGKSEETLVWEGQNVLELSATFRMEEPAFGRRHGYDALEGGTADSGDMYWHFSIEKRQEDGSWATTKDPRVFVCCVPANIYRQHGHGGRQPICYHGNRR